MKLWKTVALLVAFAGLAWYVTAYEQGEAPDFESDRTIVELMGFKDADAVTEVTVKGRGESFTVARQPAAEGEPGPGETETPPDWGITAPLKAEGDDTAIDTYVGNLLKQKAQHAYSAEQAGELTDEDAGLAQPAGSVTVKNADGTTSTFLFGAETPTGDGVYARVEGSEKLLIFEKTWVEDNVLAKALGDLREKNLLEFLTADVKSLTLQYPATTLKLTRKDGDWQMTVGDKTWPADSVAVESILSSLSSARIDEFVAREPEDLTQFGLDEPRVQVTLALGDRGTNGLIVGASRMDEAPPPPDMMGGPPPEPTEKVYVQREGDEEVLLVPGDLYDTLLKTPSDLRDKTVLALRPGEATRLAYTLGDASVVLEKSGSDWQLKQPTELKADADKVDELLSIFESLRATEIIDEPGDLAQYGLAQPAGRVEVKAGDRELPTLLLGKRAADDTGLYVKRSDQPAVMKVRGGLIDELETNPQRLRDLQVMAFDRAKVQKLALRQSNGDLVVVERQGENEWQVTKPEELDADASRVGQVLTALENLHADEYVAAEAEDLAKYGLDKPTVIATVTMEGGEVHTLYVAEDPESTFQVYLKRKGQPAIYKNDMGVLLADLQKQPEDFEPLPEPEMPAMGGFQGGP